MKSQVPRALALAGAALATSLAAAQSVAPFDPSLLDRQQRDNQRLQQERERLLAPPRRAVEPPARPEIKPTAVDARFTLKAVDFGPSVFISRDELQAIAAPYVGKEVSFNTLNEMLEKINALYAQRGQAFARAFLPPQRVDDGHVRINLVEAKADTIAYEGNRYLSQGWAERLVDTRQGEVIDALKLDRTLDRFQRGSEARFAIDVEPGTQPGTSALKVKVVEPERLRLAATLGNEGNDNTGREQATADLTLFSPLGRGDRAGLGLVASRGLKSLNLSYLVQLNPGGTRLAANLADARTKIVNGPFAINDIQGQSRSVGVQLVQPVFDSRPWSLEAVAGWGRSLSETSIGGLSLGEGQVNQYSVGLQATRRDDVRDWAGAVAWVPFRSVGAAGGVTRSAKLEWSTSYVQRVEGRGALLFRANGQASRSANPLAGVGQLSFGGAGLLRAYPAGSLLGDSGYAMSLEWHAAFSEAVGWNVFAERAEVWGSVARTSLGDAGAGLEWRVNDKATLNASFAHAFNDGPSGGSRNRLYLRLSASY